MPAPTPSTSLFQNGKAFVASWNAVWSDTNGLTDSIVVNVSDLAYTNRIRIYQIHIATTAGISATLEFDDASSDVEIYRHPIGIVGNIVLDFSDIGGLIWNGITVQPDGTKTDTGDLLVTSSSQASGDEISILVIGRCS